MTKALLTTALTASAFFAGSAQGATIIDDPFTDGGFTDGADPQDANWLVEDGGITLSIDPDEITGNTLQASAGSNNREIGAYFDAVTLAEVGDYIELKFDYKYPGAGDFRRGFGFNLGNSNGTGASGSSLGVFTDDTGFGANFNPGTPDSTSDGQLYELTGGGTNNLGGVNTVDPGDTVHEVTLRITRIDDGGTPAVQLDYTTDIIASGSDSAIDNTPATFSFDRVIFSLSGSGNQGPYFLDDVLITTNVEAPAIPEPASAALIAVGSSLLLGRRRR